MKLLIDTHCWLWQFADPTRLRVEVVDMLCTPENEVYLSAASAWEIVIKHALGKLTLPEPPERYIPSRLSAQGLTFLPIDLRHVLQVVGLPMVHRDPEGRMLVAQAQAESMGLVTADRLVAAYDVQIIWASR